MLKKASTEKVSLGLRCGDCVHFRNGPARFEKLCAEMGVDERSRAPDCYTPDVFKLKNVKEPDLLGRLGALIKDMGPSQVRILSFILARQGGTLARHNLKFGEPVYFSLGENYVSHYFKGYVISASDEHVYIAAKLKKCEQNTSVTLLRDSVYTRTEYKALEEKLIKEGRIYMDAADKRRCRTLPIAELLDKKGCVPHVEQFIDDYEPPTLDTAPASWFNIYEAKRQHDLKKKSKKRDKKRIPMVEEYGEDRKGIRVKKVSVDRNTKQETKKQKVEW